MSTTSSSAIIRLKETEQIIMEVYDSLGQLETGTPGNVYVTIIKIDECTTPETIVSRTNTGVTELTDDAVTPNNLGLWCYCWTPDEEGTYLVFMESGASFDRANATIAELSVMVSLSPITDTEQRRERNYFTSTEIDGTKPPNYRFVPADHCSHVHVQLKTYNSPDFDDDDYDEDDHMIAEYYIIYYYDDATPHDLPIKMMRTSIAPSEADGTFYLKHPDDIGAPW